MGAFWGDNGDQYGDGTNDLPLDVHSDPSAREASPFHDSWLAAGERDEGDPVEDTAGS